MSLTELEIQRYTRPISAELDRQKEKNAKLKAQVKDLEAQVAAWKHDANKEWGASATERAAKDAEIANLKAHVDALESGMSEDAKRIHQLSADSDAPQARVELLELAIRKSLAHATDEKSPGTAPPRNRMQNMVCLLSAALEAK
ncbi:MAG: hypothetical protein WC986_14425 [Elusimicrobiota bacterium]|jgi:predicted RNase H-like nuclease (RuvC/YqgF family)